MPAKPTKTATILMRTGKKPNRDDWLKEGHIGHRVLSSRP